VLEEEEEEEEEEDPGSHVLCHEGGALQALLLVQLPERHDVHQLHQVHQGPRNLPVGSGNQTASQGRELGGRGILLLRFPLIICTLSLVIVMLCYSFYCP